MKIRSGGGKEGSDGQVGEEVMIRWGGGDDDYL